MNIECGMGAWGAEITDNFGNAPYTYLWEVSTNGVSSWTQIGNNTPFLTGIDLSNASYTEDKFFLRVTVLDSSSPQESGSGTINVTQSNCFTNNDGSSTRKELENGIEEKSINSGLSPNPVQDYAYYTFEFSPKILIKNLSGETFMVIQSRISDSQIYLNLNSLNSGIWIIIEEDDFGKPLKSTKMIKI